MKTGMLSLSYVMLCLVQLIINYKTYPVVITCPSVCASSGRCINELS